MKKFFSIIAAVLFAGSMMATTVTKTVAELAVEKSFTNSAVCTPFDLDEVISVSTSATDANTGKYYSNGEQIRLYQTGAASITLTAAEGYKISSVTLTYASQNTGILLEAESGVAVDFDNVQSATFTVGNSGDATNGQARITEFSVTYDADGAVPPTPADTYTVAGNDAAIFGEAWNPALTANDMTLANGIYKWEKAELDLTAGTIEFKVAKNHNWDIAYPAQNYVVNIAEAGEYTLTITFDPTTEAVAAEAVKKEPLADPTNCAEAAAAALSVSANNELYNNGAVYTIEGYVTSIKTAYNDQYHNVSFWMADAVDGGEVLQAYRAACASEEDVPAVGAKVQVTGTLTKYGTTPEFSAGCTFVITEAPAPAEEYYLTGSFRNWATTAESDFHFVANPAAAGEYMLQGIALAANAEIKVIGILDENVSYYPDGMDNNYQVAVDSVYDIYFRPDGQGGEGWHYGYFYVVGAPVVVPPTAISCLDVYQMAKGDVVDLLNDVTVTFANGKNVWVVDGSASMLIYFSANTTYAPGDVLSGIAGTVDIYNGVTEIKPSADQAAAIVATPGEVPAAIQTVVVEAADVNKYIVMPEIEFEEDAAFAEGTASNITMNGVVVRNNFKNGFAFEAGKKYNVYGVVTIYQNNPQVYFITAVEATETAISNTNAAVKAVKVIREGQLFIEKNGVLYNAQGAVVR